LHDIGHARYIEVCHENTLVGVMYRVAQAALFYDHYMCSRAENASKTALLVFCQDFADSGGKLIDFQVLNNLTASLGAV
ncbi:leucyl/phenylalanyl-tRNA--protein transferase, partial [Klebsiella pneumoniae]|nr:leucyl/phenylalanyl-tRNA--protein transferase [Klebsiella pneumoniae]